MYGFVLVGKAPAGRAVDVMPGVKARRTEPAEIEAASVLTMVLTLPDDLPADLLAEWLLGRLSTYRGRPIAPETITIEGQTVAFRRDEMTRAIAECMTR
jgi:hypothetical protein